MEEHRNWEGGIGGNYFAGWSILQVGSINNWLPHWICNDAANDATPPSLTCYPTGTKGTKHTYNSDCGGGGII